MKNIYFNCQFKITMSNRCQCKTKNGFVCKNKHKFIVQSKRYCTIHIQCNFKKIVNQIQRIYKGYIIRKKLTNLFYNLPIELQHLVVKHMREPLYIEQTNKTISKILSNKFDNIFKNTHIYYEEIINLNNLFIKYNKITDTIYDNSLVYFNNIIIRLFEQTITDSVIYDENNNSISSEILFKKYELMYDVFRKYYYVYRENF